MLNIHSLLDQILNCQVQVAELQGCLSAFPALSPSSGGKGELGKALYIQDYLEKLSIPCKRCDCPDKKAQNGIRPNIIAKLPGRSSRTLWLFAHMDVVPAGDLSAWKSDPWKVRREGDYLIARGVEDNQQAICSMLVLATCLKKSNFLPFYGLGLIFMADEECGSQYGLRHILKEEKDIFSPEDLYIVPDGGSPSGAEIEIAEKAQLWLKFTIMGKQAHASAPQNGINAFEAASALVVNLHKLHDYFPERNKLFNPPYSTFVATRHEENVPAINIMPGKDVFYMDCRLLPDIKVEAVLKKIQDITSEIELAMHVKINFEVSQYQKATEVPLSSPIINILGKAIEKVYEVKPRPVGIGGATVAAFLREKNLSAVVWSCILNTCHQPNEISSISATLRDSAVFALVLSNL